MIFCAVAANGGGSDDDYYYYYLIIIIIISITRVCSLGGWGLVFAHCASFIIIIIIDEYPL